MKRTLSDDNQYVNCVHLLYLAAQSVVTGITGHSVVLHCPGHPLYDNVTGIIATGWSKGHDASQLLARVTTIKSRRISMYTISEDLWIDARGDLNIRHLKMSDAGFYTFRVFGKSNTEVQLFVVKGMYMVIFGLNHNIDNPQNSKNHLKMYISCGLALTLPSTKQAGIHYEKIIATCHIIKCAI